VVVLTLVRAVVGITATWSFRFHRDWSSRWFTMRRLRSFSGAFSISPGTAGPQHRGASSRNSPVADPTACSGSAGM